MTTATIVADIDSHMEAALKDDNFGTLVKIECSNVWAGATKLSNNRAIGNFDLSDIPAGATIDSAKLVQNIYQVDSGNRAATIYRCTRGPDVADPWTETGVTWFDYAAPADWDDAGGDFTDTDKVTFTFPASTGEFEITGMKTLVEDAIAERDNVLSVIIHFDLETQGSGNDRYLWRSREYGTAAERWRLVVDYTPPPAAGQPAGHRSVPRTSFGEKARSARPAVPRHAFAGARTARPSDPQRRRSR